MDLCCLGKILLSEVVIFLLVLCGSEHHYHYSAYMFKLVWNLLGPAKIGTTLLRL